MKMHRARRRHSNNSLIAALSRQHQGQERLRDDIPAAQVDVEAPPPLVLVAVENPVVAREKAGVADEDVEAASCSVPRDLSDCRLYARAVGDVHGQGQDVRRRAPAGVPDRVDGVGADFSPRRDDDTRGAGARVRQGDAEADPLVAACDQHGFAGAVASRAGVDVGVCVGAGGLDEFGAPVRSYGRVDGGAGGELVL